MSENILYQILELATAIFETLIVQQYISSFFDRYVKAQRAFIGYFLFFLGLGTLSLFCRQPLILAGYSVLGTLALAIFNYNGNIILKCFSALFFGVLMIGSEIMCAGIFSLFGGITLENNLEYGLDRVLFVVIAKITQIFMVKFLGLFIKWKTSNSDVFEIKAAFVFMICQVISIILSYNIFMTAYHTQEDLTISAMFSILGIMYVNIILFWYFDRIKSTYAYIHEKEVAEAKLEFQRQYYELLEEHQQETEALWHDMKKHLSSIKELYEMDLKLNTEQYINIFENKINAIPKIVRTAIPTINAILIDEFRKAKKENIDIRLDVHISQELKINDFDLCVLLGNLAENAIEACQLLPKESERFIDISILQENFLILIDIKNPYNSANNNISRKNRKHGYGLKNVRKVVKNYGGDIEIKNLDNIFHISVIIA